MIYILPFLMFFGANTLFAQSNEGFAQPMKVTPVVSGSFAELRSNHFHSGTDLSTVGRIGVPVYSVMSGYVSRIKISSGGYGKALYIDHPNGQTSVYAHLDGYVGRIDSLVRATQYDEESYEVEILPEPGKIKVTIGEQVALSGNTGSSGGPHLHFEIRDTKTQDPIEPMSYLANIKDDVPPAVYGVKVYPLGSFSTVEKGGNAIYFPLVPSGGKYVLKDKKYINVAGEIGVGVHTIDFLTNNHRKCGIADIKLFCDDVLVFHSNLSRISFATTRYINSYIDYADRVQNTRFIQKSFVDPNNKLDVYRKHQMIEVIPGEHKNLKYEICDASNNLSIVEFVLVGVEPSQNPTDKKPGNNEYKVLWNRSFVYDTDDLSIYIAPESTYKDEIIKIAISKHQSFTNPVYQVGNYDVAIQNPYELSIAIPDNLIQNQDKSYIAAIDRNNKVSYMGGGVLNNRLVVKSRQFGRFTVLADNVAPTVTIKPVTNNDYSAKRYLDITIKDDGSGISSYRCEIDGKWQLFEYEYKAALLRGDLSKMKLKKGTKHNLVVKVKDAVGNEKIQNYSFIY